MLTSSSFAAHGNAWILNGGPTIMASALQFSPGNSVVDPLQSRSAFAHCKEISKARTRRLRCKEHRDSRVAPFLKSKPIVPLLSPRVRGNGKTRAGIAHCLLQSEAPCNVFEGLNGSGKPVEICDTRSLQPAISLEDALINLRSTLKNLETYSPPSASGTLRFQVPLPPGLKALQWLQSQPLSPSLLPRSYFSPREARDHGTGETKSASSMDFSKLDTNGIKGVAGVGAAILFSGSDPFSFKDWKAIKRFLSKDHPLIRVYGAMRFDPKMKPANEWQAFGSFYFFIPQIEFCECDGCSLLAVTLTWDNKMDWPFTKALHNAFATMQTLSTRICPDNERPLAQVVHREHVPDEQSWHDDVNSTLQLLSSHGLEHLDADKTETQGVSNASVTLSKVVMARRSKLELNGHLDPVSLLACLQDKDPSAYQFAVQVPDGSAFIGCSPERLFVRNGLLVASEAVAGTCARGSTVVSDLRLGLALLQSKKDVYEFEIVRDWMKLQMETVCKRVTIEGDKTLLKQARVQHLYARLNGELYDDTGEYDLLSALHPTPAVCGLPQKAARDTISANEAFDRGLYAGPVGWFGGNDAEFVVGIRSSLIQPSTSDGLQNGHISQPFQPPSRSDSPRADIGETILRNFSSSLNSQEVSSKNSTVLQKGTHLSLYAGVGVVKGSVPASEWRELELKTSQFEALLAQRQPLNNCANINALWAHLIIEECCRLGNTYFCIAPGSRSSPITVAAAANPRVTCVPCIDERSMAFHALGYGKGAHKGAVVVTSSGTAVSNLLPAVVEASQDFIPLVVLTADREAELQDTGANQTIDQAKHFGGFVRFHANLPAPDGKLPAKMILTTIDAAVNRSTTAPAGPVHINCAFREPLAPTPQAWNAGCLKGLERWTATSTPYTQYIDGNPRLMGGVHPTFVTHLEGVGELIRNARKGILVVGGLFAAEETWAVALLAQHLGWPVIPDVLSGLRIGEALRNGGVGERKVNIIHNFDQILLSKIVAEASNPDVVLQIGSRLTSKRILQFLEAANLQAYIVVDEHLSRHDPAHIVTHRIQCSTAEFSSTVMKVTKSMPRTAFCGELKLLSDTVKRKIHSLLQAESSLTEPFVAHYVVSCLPAGSALFLGNSMPIRDVDMYAHGAVEVLGPAKCDESLNDSLPHIGARVGANRGASGIDGIVSTAIGFAAGCKQRVTLLLGDVSFLHDTNGLSLLSERPGQPPLTIVVVNNCGGGIFSLLPVADIVSEESFSALFSTQHAVNLRKLCEAHRVNHHLVQSKDELKNALKRINDSPSHWVIEVESKIKDNADFHRFLSFSIGQSVTQAFHVLSKFPPEAWDTDDHKLRISEASYSHHSFTLVAPPSTRPSSSEETQREGFILQVTLLDGSLGIGEVAPLRGLHKESLLDVEEQLRVIAQRIQSRVLTRTLPLLDGSFSHWLYTVAGIEEKSLLPSVRIGLEMAIFGALAESQGCSLLELFSGTRRLRRDEVLSEKSPRHCEGNVLVCGLLDSEGSPADVADAAAQLVKEGFDTLKLKVGRRSSLDDATAIRKVRERVGPAIHLRADANRKWSYQRAKDFAKAVQSCGLQYLEEPLRNPSEISRFCLETGMPVALDESLDDAQSNIEDYLQQCASQGVVAVVIKPAVIGSFEKASLIIQAAQTHGMIAVISSAFESSLSLLNYSQFAAYVDEKWKAAFVTNHAKHAKGHFGIEKIAHGLGTYKWLKDGSLFPSKVIETSIQVSNHESAVCLQKISLHMKIQPASSKRSEMISHKVNVTYQQEEYFFHVQTSAAPRTKGVGKLPTLVFLHGFLGSGQDWFPIMSALSTTFRCISIDLLGHGKTTVKDAETQHQQVLPLASRTQRTRATFADNQDAWSIDGLGEALTKLFEKLESERIVLVGYSMGARIALHVALRHSERVSMAIIVSGHPGLQDASAQKLRAAQDDDLALRLCDSGLYSFVEWWYKGSLWKSLRSHPDFKDMKRSRGEHCDVGQLAKSLSAFSIGRQRPLWQDLSRCQIPLLLVAGGQDKKFVNIAHQMVEAMDGAGKDSKRKEVDLLDGNASKPSGDSQDVAARLRQNGATFTAKGSSVNPCDTRAFPPKLLVVEDSGHAVHIETPMQLAKAIREFVLSSVCQDTDKEG